MLLLLLLLLGCLQQQQQRLACGGGRATPIALCRPLPARGRTRAARFGPRVCLACAELCACVRACVCEMAMMIVLVGTHARCQGEVRALLFD